MQNSLEKDVNNPDKLCIFTSILSKKVSDYFGDDEHRKQFEEWYRKKVRERVCMALILLK